MMRIRPVLALAGFVTAACSGPGYLDEILDPVPEGKLEFLVESGVYDAHFVTLSNTCSDVNLDVVYSTWISGDHDPYFQLDSPSVFIGMDPHWNTFGNTRQIHENPSVITASTEVPYAVAVESAVWIERAGPGMLELRYETLAEDCEHIGRLTLQLRD